jgi:hypothetical protein
MIMHLIQMEQQKMSALEPQLNVAATSAISGGMSSGTSMVTAGTVLPPGSAPKTTEVAHIPSVRPQVPMQQPPLVNLFCPYLFVIPLIYLVWLLPVGVLFSLNMVPCKQL